MALRVLRGDRLFVVNPSLNAGVLPVEGSKIVSLDVRNYTSRIVHIIGLNSKCTCVSATELALTIQVGEATALKILVRHLPGKEHVDEAMVFYTDSPTALRLGARIRAEVGRH